MSLDRNELDLQNTPLTGAAIERLLANTNSKIAQDYFAIRELIALLEYQEQEKVYFRTMEDIRLRKLADEVYEDEIRAEIDANRKVLVQQYQQAIEKLPKILVNQSAEINKPTQYQVEVLKLVSILSQLKNVQQSIQQIKTQKQKDLTKGKKKIAKARQRQIDVMDEVLRNNEFDPAMLPPVQQPEREFTPEFAEQVGAIKDMRENLEKFELENLTNEANTNGTHSSYELEMLAKAKAAEQVIKAMASKVSFLEHIREHARYVAAIRKERELNSAKTNEGNTLPTRIFEEARRMMAQQEEKNRKLQNVSVGEVWLETYLRDTKHQRTLDEKQSEQNHLMNEAADQLEVVCDCQPQEKYLPVTPKPRPGFNAKKQDLTEEMKLQRPQSPLDNNNMTPQQVVQILVNEINLSTHAMEAEIRQSVANSYKVNALANHIKAYAQENFPHADNENTYRNAFGKAN